MSGAVQFMVGVWLVLTNWREIVTWALYLFVMFSPLLSFVALYWLARGCLNVLGRVCLVEDPPRFNLSAVAKVAIVFIALSHCIAISGGLSIGIVSVVADLSDSTEGHLLLGLGAVVQTIALVLALGAGRAVGRAASGSGLLHGAAVGVLMALAGVVGSLLIQDPIFPAWIEHGAYLSMIPVASIGASGLYFRLTY